MMRAMKSVFCFVFLFLPTLSYAELPDFAKTYLREMENRNAAVFLSRCGSNENEFYTATLIIEVGSKKGLLIEEKNNVVVNLASVSIGEKGPVVEETHGGVYSYERVLKVVEELIKYRFHLLTPFRIRDLNPDRAMNKCLSVP